MKLINMELQEFADALNSDLPAPGGGSAAAYVSSMGVALTRMLGHLTISKKKFLELEESQQEEFKKNFDLLQTGYLRLLDIVDEDTECFNEVMKAYKMPKETEQEIILRKAAIAKAMENATYVPMLAADIAFECLTLTPSFIEHGNKNAISDLASGMYLLQAGMNCSILNVKINISSLEDEDQVKNLVERCDKLKQEAQSIIDQNITIIEAML